jgi:hypothetical protein
VHGRGFESLTLWGVNGGVVHVKGSNLSPLGVNGVVHGHGFESSTFGSMVMGSNLDFWGVNGGVVHGRGFESLTFGGLWWCSAWLWVRIFYFLGGQWWCSAWSLVRIFDFVGVDGGVVHGRGLEFLTLGGSMVV